MQKVLYAILVGIAFVSVILIIPISDSAIPPTNAFSKVYINGQLIEADQHDDTLYITTTGSLTTSIDGDAVTIKIKELTCPILQAVKSVDANGNLVCAVI